MNTISPKNGQNNGAICPFLMYNGTAYSKTVQCASLEGFTTECCFSQIVVVLLLLLKYATKPL